MSPPSGGESERSELSGRPLDHSMSYTKTEAIDALYERWSSSSKHLSRCPEVEFHVWTDSVDRPDRDGVVNIECTNCVIQDHFLYSED